LWYTNQRLPWNILRKDRNCFGGEVLVYISETLKVKRREDLEFENSEMIWVEIELPNNKIVLCVVYRIIFFYQ
jgi:hypothetical protein